MFEIGNSLREARVRQGLDYPQVELATKIRAKYIRALEEEEFGVLPGGTYIKGFMRSYAEFLGLDGQLYVDEYNSRHVVVDGLDDVPARRPRVHQDRSIERKVVLLTLAGIATVTALVIVAWKFGGGGSPTTTPPVVQKQQPAPAGLRFVGHGTGTYLTVWKRPWVGKPAWQGTLRAGDSEFLIGKRFWLSVKRPAGVRLKLAGKPITLPARHNVHVVVPAKTARTGG
jgi:hypothetical protein